MKVALIILKRLGNNFNLDVLEGKHTNDLPPARHAAAEEVLDNINCRSHLIK